MPSVNHLINTDLKNAEHRDASFKNRNWSFDVDLLQIRFVNHSVSKTANTAAIDTATPQAVPHVWRGIVIGAYVFCTYMQGVYFNPANGEFRPSLALKLR